ncbi:MAG: NAD-binding protein [Halobacteriales archaeon]|nr:NAD-binding protein [Halobacteriales archaeon]
MSGERQDAPSDSALEELFYRTDRVRLVHWEQFLGAQTAIVLTGLVTFLSFVSGLSHLSGEAGALQGPLAPVLPGAVLFARFGSVLFAFLLGILTFGLRRRKQIAWYGTVGVLPLLALIPLITFRTTDIPLLVLVLFALPLLVWNRDRFDQSLGLSPLQIASLSSIGGVALYGTVGAYGLRDQFLKLNSWPDAFYYVIVTIATVGYGDITPTSPIAKWFSLSIILFGTGAFTIAVGALIGPAIESRMAAAVGNMSAAELTLLEDHVLVLGYGDITESVLEELSDEVEIVVVTEDSDVASTLKDEGINVLTDDPTDATALEDASIETARGVVVATRDDAKDVMAILAARKVNPDVRIVAAANQDKHVDKLEQVGADEVISPMVIGGRILGQSVLDEVDNPALFGTGATDETDTVADDSEDR